MGAICLHKRRLAPTWRPRMYFFSSTTSKRASASASLAHSLTLRVESTTHIATPPCLAKTRCDLRETPHALAWEYKLQLNTRLGLSPIITRERRNGGLVFFRASISDGKAWSSKMPFGRLWQGRVGSHNGNICKDEDLAALLFDYLDGPWDDSQKGAQCNGHP